MELNEQIKKYRTEMNLSQQVSFFVKFRICGLK